MTVIRTDEILARLRTADFKKRLVLSPLLNEEEQAKPGQAAVDMRLGFDFCLVTASSFGSISEFPKEEGQPHSFSKLYRREYVPFGSSIVIHPHQFMLAQTLEYIRLPDDLMAYVVGRSTWGRLGLIVATAIGIHPGFAGCLTLELRNLGETPLTLFPGQTVAQLFFHSVSGKKNKIKAPLEAQYSGSVDMVPKKISSNKTHDILEKLIDRFKSSSSI